MPSDFRRALRVKVKSLAEEARIIRREENLAKTPWEVLNLREHRTGIVRRAMREALLAYGFIRGLAYGKMEAKANDPPDWKNVRSMVVRYGQHSDHRQRTPEKDLLERFEAWKTT